MLDRDPASEGAYNATMRRIPLAFAAATTLSNETVSVYSNRDLTNYTNQNFVNQLDQC